LDTSRLQQLRLRYLELYPADPADPAQVEAVERAIGVVLPRDMKEIASVFHGGMVGVIPQFTIGFGPYDNVVDETRRTREALGLPHRFVMLSIQSESVVVMETQADEQVNAPVTWLDNEDMDRLIAGQPLAYDPTTFASYADWFEYMLSTAE
jgi:hypothetical protein